MKSKQGIARAAVGIAAGLAIALTGCAGGGGDGGSGGSKDSLVIASWGGAFSAATKEELADPFSAEEGISVQIADASSQHVAQVESQTAAGNVTWDVIDSLGDANTSYLAGEGLLEPLPADLKKRLEEVSIPGGVTDYSVLQSTIATIIVCNPDEVTACPTTPAELFDTEKFPGPRMMYNDPYYLIMSALIADGRTADDLFPISDADVDRAFEMLEAIAPSVRVWWTSADQSQQAMQNGEAVMGLIWNGPASRLAESSPQMEFSWKGGTLSTAWTSVVKGAPNTEGAFAYLEWYATHPEAQAAWASRTGYGVSNPEAIDYLTDQEAAFSVMNPANAEGLALGDGSWWVDHREALTERWQSIVGG